MFAGEMQPIEESGLVDWPPLRHFSRGGEAIRSQGPWRFRPIYKDRIAEHFFNATVNGAKTLDVVLLPRGGSHTRKRFRLFRARECHHAILRIVFWIGFGRLPGHIDEPILRQIWAQCRILPKARVEGHQIFYVCAHLRSRRAAEQAIQLAWLDLWNRLPDRWWNRQHDKIKSVALCVSRAFCNRFCVLTYCRPRELPVEDGGAAFGDGEPADLCAEKQFRAFAFQLRGERLRKRLAPALASMKFRVVPETVESAAANHGQNGQQTLFFCNDTAIGLQHFLQRFFRLRMSLCIANPVRKRNTVQFARIGIEPRFKGIDDSFRRLRQLGDELLHSTI